jgi:hypothetical protein
MRGTQHENTGMIMLAERCIIRLSCDELKAKKEFVCSLSLNLTSPSSSISNAAFPN